MKKNLLSSLFLAFSLCPSMAGNLLKVDHFGVHFEENLKQFSDKKITKLVALKRENEEQFKKNIQKYYDKEKIINITLGKGQEEQKNEALQHLLWEAISKKVDYDIALPKTKDIFLPANLNELKIENQEKIDSLENFENIYLFIKSLKLNYKDIFFTLNNITEKVFKFYNIYGDFLDIAKMVFQKTFIQYIIVEKGSFDICNILDIMMYVRHQISQFDVSTKITLQHEKSIKEKLERKFAFYRKKKLEGTEGEILDFEQKVLTFNKSNILMSEKSKSQIIEEVNKNIDFKNIIKPLKSIAKNVIFDFINEFIYEEFGPEKIINLNGLQNIKTYFLEIIKYVAERTKGLSDRYTTAFHEGAHAFMALHHNIGIKIATCIRDGSAAGFVQIDTDFINNEIFEKKNFTIAEYYIKVLCAGILGGFSIDGILNKDGASSDFNAILSLCEKILSYTKCFTKDIPDSKKIKELSEKGMNMLSENQELPKNHVIFDYIFIGTSPLDPFLNFDIAQKIKEKTQDEQNKIKNIIAGCIVETFNILQDPENNVHFQMLSEKIFEEGIIPQEKIERYGKDVEEEEFLNYVKNNNNQKSFSKKEAELMLHNDFRHFSIHKITIEEINKEMEEKIEEINRNM